MAYGFKRVLYGYDPVWVRNNISLLNEEFEKDRKQLEERLVQINAEIDRLRQEIQKLKKDVENLIQKENSMDRMLLQAHLEATRRVFEAQKNAKQMEKMKNELISQRENECRELKRTLKGLSEELQLKIDEYRNKFESLYR